MELTQEEQKALLAQFTAAALTGLLANQGKGDVFGHNNLTNDAALIGSSTLAKYREILRGQREANGQLPQ